MKLGTILSRFVYKNICKPVFFAFDPEFVHDRMTGAGEMLGRFRWSKYLVRKLFSYENRSLEQDLWSIKFKNPVGLSAGFDKDAQLYPIMGSVGFGFAEVGTITFGAYDGNPKPRLYRLPKSKGLVVYYGLKNMGAKATIGSLQKKTKNIPQVISMGRTNSKETVALEKGLADYLNCVKEFKASGVGDIYEINISCPNTFGGEPFFDEANLEKLLAGIRALDVSKPIFIKMPIHLPWLEFKKIVDIALRFGVDALTIGNLAKDRDGVKDKIPDNVSGGLSGKLTEKLSNDLISATYKYCGDKIKIIGVGGIFSAEDAYEKIRRGASLVELITGMIYEGPQLIGEINKKLAQFLERDGYKNISEAVGTL